MASTTIQERLRALYPDRGANLDAVRNLRMIIVIIEIPSNKPVATMGMKLQSRFAMIKLKIYLLVSFIYSSRFSIYIKKNIDYLNSFPNLIVEWSFKLKVKIED